MQLTQIKKAMKILNLYAGIGGNRQHWGQEHEITAVEINPKIADDYKLTYPSDNVIIADAHEYLLANHKNFDFIWSSPPCQTHSRTNYFINNGIAICPLQNHRRHVPGETEESCRMAGELLDESARKGSFHE